MSGYLSLPLLPKQTSAESAAQAIRNVPLDASEDSNEVTNIPHSQPFASLHPRTCKPRLRQPIQLQKDTSGMTAERSSAMGGSHGRPPSDSGSEYDALPSYEDAISTGLLADAARSTGILCPRLSQRLGSIITD